MANYNFTESLSDEATLQELGERLGRQRIEAGLTQEQLAQNAGVSKRTVERLEAGRDASLATLIRVLRELKLSAGFNALVPLLPPSPIEQLKLRGRERQRVRVAGKPRPGAKPPWQWGE